MHQVPSIGFLKLNYVKSLKHQDVIIFQALAQWSFIFFVSILSYNKCILIAYYELGLF